MLVYRLASDGNPRFVGVDLASESDMGCECEMDRLPDGTWRVLDIRYYEKAPGVSTGGQ